MFITKMSPYQSDLFLFQKNLLCFLMKNAIFSNKRRFLVPEFREEKTSKSKWRNPLIFLIFLKLVKKHLKNRIRLWSSRWSGIAMCSWWPWYRVCQSWRDCEWSTCWRTQWSFWKCIKHRSRWRFIQPPHLGSAPWRLTIHHGDRVFDAVLVVGQLVQCLPVLDFDLVEDVLPQRRVVDQVEGLLHPLDPGLELARPLFGVERARVSQISEASW